jgi:hypothetical protein
MIAYDVQTILNVPDKQRPRNRTPVARSLKYEELVELARPLHQQFQIDKTTLCTCVYCTVRRTSTGYRQISDFINFLLRTLFLLETG